MPKKTDSRVYEAMFLVDSGDAASWTDLAKHLSAILTRSGADVIGLTRWDERKLAYTVQRRKRGTYVLAFFVLTKGDAVAEIERDCALSEKVLRTLILRADHFTVADMRLQLGEDIREDAARRLMAERGEQERAAAVVGKPARAPEAEAAPETERPPRERGHSREALEGTDER
ncbi:MAG: 30S ribosomal protein S6 [Planctomycetes bacterium]|nr:30S ribosomal protein S6 [Planctomycetota bacterium]